MDYARRTYPEAEKKIYDSLFANITRPRERYSMPAATWYCLGIIIVLVLCDKTTAEVRS